MTKLHTALLAATLGLTLAGTARAQSPAIPTPANPTPVNPIATDGTPLPRRAGGPLYAAPVYEGRSVFAPVGAVVGGGLGLAGGAVDAGLDTAGTILGR